MLIILKKKDVKENYVFGYRTSFSLSSKEAWKWANGMFVKYSLVGCPILLLIHITVFVFSLIYDWPFWFVLITMNLPMIFLFILIPIIEIRGRKIMNNIENK